MKDFVEFLLKQIVNDPDKVKVEEVIEGTIVNLKACVAQEDMGIVIGKDGKTINSLRSLTKAKAIKEGVKVYLELC